MVDKHAVSVLLKIPVGTLDQWASRGIGPRFAKIGRHRRYRPIDVERWIDEHSRGGAAVPAPLTSSGGSTSKQRRGGDAAS